MRKKRFALSSIVLLLAPVGILSSTQRANAATATATDIPNPDAYTCGQSGYINFERMADGTNLSSGAINGVQFTTTNGFTWRVGDFATHNYNGKYPNGGYTSQGTHWAWLGPNQGAGRIDFVGGPASVFSLLTSDNLTPVRVDAYRADNTLLASAGPGPLNYNTGHMTELKITRDTADIAYVIVHDSGNFFLVDSICTNASGVPNQALNDFKQNKNADGSNVPWAGDHLFNVPSCATMAQEGCVITAVTDVLSSYGLQNLPDGTATDPGHLNHYLGLKSGTYEGDCNIMWSNAGRVLNYSVANLDFASSTSLDKRLKDIDAALAAGNLAIVSVQGAGHWIVLYAKASSPASDGSPDYRIVDPYRYPPYATGDRSGELLSQAYGTVNHLQGTLNVVVYQNNAPKPGKSWAIVAHSPVQLLITDPNGVQTGFDPATGSNLSNIPGSAYGWEQGLIDDTGQQPPQPNEPYFEQNALTAGTYTVEVIGTGSGPYSLDFGFASGPDDTSKQTISGTAVPGAIDTYLVTVSPTPGQIATIVRKVQVDIKPGGTPNPINVGSSGVIPVAILSSPTFDATSVAFASVRFGPAGAAPVDKAPGVTDVNGDGLPDVVLHFRTTETGITSGATQACLTGTSTVGPPIIGCDAIVTVP